MSDDTCHLMMPKQKILCVHGYRQNAAKFRSQTGALRKILKAHAEFHYISAPHEIVDTEKEENEKEDDQRSWWFTNPTSFTSKDETDEHFGFEESLKLIKETFQNQGPFHGVLGFSQGAALVAILCALKERGETDGIIDCTRSHELANIFICPVVINHSGGHFVPGSSSLKEQYISFITKQNQGS